MNDRTTTNGFKAFWWIMGVIAMLLSAGVIGSIATYASVARLETNITLLRAQMERELDQEQERIERLEGKLDAHMNARPRQGGL